MALPKQTYTVDTWEKCYRESWKGIATPQSIKSHPAKFSKSLIERIYDHATECGWANPGSYVLDPFGGVGLGAYPAMLRGLNFVGIEIEQDFVKLGQGCECWGITPEEWVRDYGRPHALMKHRCPKCLSDFSEVLPQLPDHLFDPRPISASYVRNSGKIPFTHPHHYAGNIETWEALGLPGTGQLVNGDSRRIGEAITGIFNMSITSPPFMAQSGGTNVTSTVGPLSDPALLRRHSAGNAAAQGYGDSPANLGNMKPGSFELSIGSPPYADSEIAVGLESGSDPEERKRKRAGGEWEGYNRSNPANLGNLKAGEFPLSVSSPPYASARIDGNGDEGASGLRNPDGSYHRGSEGWEARKSLGGRYGDTEGQIANDPGSFWDASREIVEQVYKHLLPGGVAVWVTKRYVNGGEIVDFSRQWERLCNEVGFRTLHWHRASLVEDRGTQFDLYGNGHKKTVERKSFFRRLAESKGSPRIDWEDVICMEK